MFLLGTLAACQSSYDVRSASGGNANRTIPPAASVFVAEPPNGRFGRSVYAGSGSMTAQALVAALSPMIEVVKASNGRVGRAEGMAQAKQGGFTHYAEPIIVLWEERATEWSGKPDRIIIRITVLEVASGQIVDVSTIQGNSKWATLGGDHPQDLLPVPMRTYVARLVR